MDGAPRRHRRGGRAAAVLNHRRTKQSAARPGAGRSAINHPRTALIYAARPGARPGPALRGAAAEPHGEPAPLGPLLARAGAGFGAGFGAVSGPFRGRRRALRAAWRRGAAGAMFAAGANAVCALLQEARAELPQDEARALQRPLRDQGENR